jgi:hypothetical protein
MLSLTLVSLIGHAIFIFGSGTTEFPLFFTVPVLVIISAFFKLQRCNWINVWIRIVFVVANRA